MAWGSMASPTLFAVVGDALPPGRRAMGFTTLALLKRVPLVIGPVLGGLVIARGGVTPGMHILLAITIVLAAAALAVVNVVNLPRLRDLESIGVRGVWRSFPRGLRTLLVADVFARVAEGLVDVFLVIYATAIVGVSATQFGILVAIQSTTSMLVYLPAAHFADRIGAKPVVIATFIAFASFPLAVVSSSTFTQLAGAFIARGSAAPQSRRSWPSATARRSRADLPRAVGADRRDALDAQSGAAVLRRIRGGDARCGRVRRLRAA